MGIFALRCYFLSRYFLFWFLFPEHTSEEKAADTTSDLFGRSNGSQMSFKTAIFACLEKAQVDESIPVSFVVLEKHFFFLILKTKLFKPSTFQPFLNRFL